MWYLLEKQGCVGVFSFVGHSHSSDNASGSKRHQALNMWRIQPGGSDCIKIGVGFTPSTGTPFSLCTGHLQHHMSMCVFVLTHWHSSLQRTRIKKESWRKRKRKALFDLHDDSVCVPSNLQVLGLECFHFTVHFSKVLYLQGVCFRKRELLVVSLCSQSLC